jgi:hypothetical protein
MRFVLSLLVFPLVFTPSARAGEVAFVDPIGRDRRIGVGVGGGTMSAGITGKYYLNAHSAVQGFVSGAGYGASIGADYVYEKPIESYAPGRLFWGVGAGAGTWFYRYQGIQDNLLAVSGIGQVGWHFREVPLEFIIDARPTFFTGDYTMSGLTVGTGGAARFFF